MTQQVSDRKATAIGVQGVIVIAIGAAFGASAREGLAMGLNPAFGVEGYPFGTLITNLAGAFALGLLARWAFDAKRHRLVRPFFESGLIRSFTTLSALSLQTVSFLKLQAWGTLGLYLSVTVLGGLAAVWFGSWLAGRLNRAGVAR